MAMVAWDDIYVKNLKHMCIKLLTIKLKNDWMGDEV